MEILCDFCWTPGVPTWRYDVPPKTPLLSTYDPKTGIVDRTLADGALGACEACDKILSSPLRATAPTRISRRAMQHPKIQAIPKEAQKRSRDAWKKVLKRVIPLLSNRRVNTMGSDPMDGIGLFTKEKLEDKQ